MKIRINKTTSEEVILTDGQVTEITRAKLREFITPAEYLRHDGNRWVLKQDDPHWRHGSISEVFVREATEFDLAVFKVLERL